MRPRSASPPHLPVSPSPLFSLGPALAPVSRSPSPPWPRPRSRLALASAPGSRSCPRPVSRSLSPSPPSSVPPSPPLSAPLRPALSHRPIGRSVAQFVAFGPICPPVERSFCRGSMLSGRPCPVLVASRPSCSTGRLVVPSPRSVARLAAAAFRRCRSRSDTLGSILSSWPHGLHATGRSDVPPGGRRFRTALVLWPRGLLSWWPCGLLVLWPRGLLSWWPRGLLVLWPHGLLVLVPSQPSCPVASRPSCSSSWSRPARSLRRLARSRRRRPCRSVSAAPPLVGPFWPLLLPGSHRASPPLVGPSWPLLSPGSRRASPGRRVPLWLRPAVVASRPRLALAFASRPRALAFGLGLAFRPRWVSRLALVGSRPRHPRISPCVLPFRRLFALLSSRRAPGLALSPSWSVALPHPRRRSSLELAWVKGGMVVTV